MQNLFSLVINSVQHRNCVRAAQKLPLASLLNYPSNKLHSRHLVRGVNFSDPEDQREGERRRRFDASLPPLDGRPPLEDDRPPPLAERRPADVLPPPEPAAQD